MNPIILIIDMNDTKQPFLIANYGWIDTRTNKQFTVGGADLEWDLDAIVDFLIKNPRPVLTAESYLKNPQQYIGLSVDNVVDLKSIMGALHL